MARRVVAGILGCVVGVLPLLLVNVLANGAGTFGDLETLVEQNAVAFGAGALLGGVLLGGAVAGSMAGRCGGAASGGIAGIIAGALYAVMVILLVVGGAKQGWGPPIAALHPLRVSAAILLIAALLTAVALGVGALAGRGQVRRELALDSRMPEAGGASGPRYASWTQGEPDRSWDGGRAASASRPPAGVPARSSASRSAPRDRR
jgi:hypothetical protein